MQIPPIHYLHHASKFCAGYNRYLEKRKHGVFGVFNWGFFFFNVFWLSYHRMYKEMSITIYFYLLLLLFVNIGFLTPYSAGIVMVGSYFTLCFYSYYFYEQFLNRKLKFNETDPYKNIRPFNTTISAMIFSFLMVINVVVIVKFFTLFI